MKNNLLIVTVTFLLAAVSVSAFAAPATPTPSPAPVDTSKVFAIQPSHDVKAAPAAPAASAPEKLTGTVLEQADAAGYTYLRLKTASGEAWAAVKQTRVTTGSSVTVLVQMVAENFESKKLGKTFDRLAMGTLEGAGAAGASAAAPANPHAGISMPASSADEVDDAAIKVARAEGPDGRTVAEVWASRASLKDGKVAVRGQVVKFLSAIMGKNWIHLRDGSGSKAKGDNDITVTTTDTVKVGDVVLVTGTVRVDKDFGAGYTYSVIIEDASVSK